MILERRGMLSRVVRVSIGVTVMLSSNAQQSSAFRLATSVCTTRLDR